MEAAIWLVQIVDATSVQTIAPPAFPIRIDVLIVRVDTSEMNLPIDAKQIAIFKMVGESLQHARNATLLAKLAITVIA